MLSRKISKRLFLMRLASMFMNPGFRYVARFKFPSVPGGGGPNADAGAIPCMYWRRLKFVDNGGVGALGKAKFTPSACKSPPCERSAWLTVVICLPDCRFNS